MGTYTWRCNNWDRLLTSPPRADVGSYGWSWPLEGEVDLFGMKALCLSLHCVFWACKGRTKGSKFTPRGKLVKTGLSRNLVQCRSSRVVPWPRPPPGRRRFPAEVCCRPSWPCSAWAQQVYVQIVTQKWQNFLNGLMNSYHYQRRRKVYI
jgi:hypothetical protein